MMVTNGIFQRGYHMALPDNRVETCRPVFACRNHKIVHARKVRAFLIHANNVNALLKFWGKDPIVRFGISHQSLFFFKI